LAIEKASDTNKDFEFRKDSCLEAIQILNKVINATTKDLHIAFAMISYCFKVLGSLVSNPVEKLHYFLKEIDYYERTLVTGRNNPHQWNNWSEEHQGDSILERISFIASQNDS
jgi:hypothetical protein